MVEFSIIIPVHNQLQYTKMCLERIWQHTRRNYEIIVVNNASFDLTSTYLDQIPQVITIHNQDNLGFARAVNQGLGIAQGKYLIVLNNDCLVSEGWEQRLLQVAQMKDIGIVGVMSNFVSSPQLLKLNINDLGKLSCIAKEISEEYRNIIIPTVRVVGLCMLITRELIDKIGGFDPRFGLGFFEDDDFCVRSALSGYKNVIAKDVFIYHFGSISFRGKNDLKRKLLRENWQKFKEKWELPIEMPLGRKDYWESLNYDRFKGLVDRLYIPLGLKQGGVIR